VAHSYRHRWRDRGIRGCPSFHAARKTRQKDDGGSPPGVPRGWSSSHGFLGAAQHIKNVPGRKTDQKDAEWIAQLLQYGLLRASYVPCEIIRDLRDLTRMRASLSQEASRISSRIRKVLEDAHLKLASVATNVLGKSGRAMLEDVIIGEDNPEHLASRALGHLRVKIPQLRLALEGKIRTPSSFPASAVTGSNTVCRTRNCVARRKPGGPRRTKTGPGASGCSLGHDTGDRSSGSLGSSSRNRGQHGAVSNR
jgi:transposase